MYPLLETIKLQDGIFYNLNYHQKRMNDAVVELFGHMPCFSLNEILRQSEYPSDGLYKCRTLYDKDVCQVSFHAYSPRKVRQLIVVNGDHIDYHLKFSDRKAFDKLTNALKPNEDIFIIKNELLSDTSFSNIILKKNGQWFTPEKPILKGVQRQYLLDIGRLKTRNIKKDEWIQFDEIALINAMLDFDNRVEINKVIDNS